MMQPSELLKYFGVTRIPLEDTAVRTLCLIKLYVMMINCVAYRSRKNSLLSAVRKHGQSETKYPLRSMAEVGW
jgi:hypothetical protein